MSIAFSLEELIKVAVGIERQGIVFYDVMARSTRQPVARDLFIRLADAERDHMATFKKLLPEGVDSSQSEEYKREYDDYLKALIDNAVFTDEMATSDLAARIESDVEALAMGITVEKDSILFYFDMRDAVPPNIIPIVNKIIGEEKQHLSQLNMMKNSLKTGKL